MKIDCLFSLFSRVYPNSTNNKNKIIQSTTDLQENELDNEIPSGIEFCITHVECFLNLMNDKIIIEFLEFDHCCKIADKYLISMVFVYFIRAKLPCHEYSPIYFFAALYLAHDMEEDDEDLKDHLVRWGLGWRREGQIEFFLEVRDKLWFAMDHRASVSLYCCQQVWSSCPNCSLWLRERSPIHAGARRNYEPEEVCSVCQDEELDKPFIDSCSNDYSASEKDSVESGCIMEGGSFEDENDEDDYVPAMKIIRLHEE